MLLGVLNMKFTSESNLHLINVILWSDFVKKNV